MALTLLSFWSLEIGVSLLGFSLAAYVFAFYLGSRVPRTSIGRRVTAAAGVITAQLAVTAAFSFYLARAYSASVAVPMLVVTGLEVVAVGLLAAAVRE
ncbi:MAG: hypothetical protein ACP5HK_03820 [Acidilobus sp.]